MATGVAGNAPAPAQPRPHSRRGRSAQNARPKSEAMCFSPPSPRSAIPGALSPFSPLSPRARTPRTPGGTSMRDDPRFSPENLRRRARESPDIRSINVLPQEQRDLSARIRLNAKPPRELPLTQTQLAQKRAALLTRLPSASGEPPADLSPPPAKPLSLRLAMEEKRQEAGQGRRWEQRCANRPPHFYLLSLSVLYGMVREDEMRKAAEAKARKRAAEEREREWSAQLRQREIQSLWRRARDPAHSREESVRLCGEVLGKDPAHTAARAHRSQLLMAQAHQEIGAGRPEAALEALAELVRLDPTHVDAQALQGQLLPKEGDESHQ